MTESKKPKRRPVQCTCMHEGWFCRIAPGVAAPLEEKELPAQGHLPRLWVGLSDQSGYRFLYGV